MRSAYLTLVLLGVLVLAFHAAPAAAQQQASVAVETGLVRRELMAPALWVTGTVISREDSQIAAQVAGTLTWVADVGARVKQGDVLARLNDRELQLQLRNDEIQIARLKARLPYLERQVDRFTQLARTSTSTEAELDQLRVNRDELLQEIEAAGVSRERTRYDLERTRIQAPFDGVVVSRLHNVGEYLDRGQALARLVNTGALEISVQAPLDAATRVKPGQEVTVQGASGRVRTAVRSVIPVGDDVSRMLQIRLELGSGPWVIGEPVRVAIDQGSPVETLTVPRDALVLREGETYLYKVGSDNTAHKITVVAGNGVGDRVSASGDLAPGDRVIIRGAERLQDGKAVTILPAQQSGGGDG